MGLFSQQRDQHLGSMAIPGEPLNRDDPAEFLADPPATDILGLAEPASVTSIEIEMPNAEAGGDAVPE
ncbi:MAG: hypothetical protein ACTH7O_07680 [Microbacterium gubbeenense]|uniref:hypothetical protein n=1 Tax=Microbacterium gubbeenense TaxID=159896 RepID=UPI003F957A6C